MNVLVLSAIFAVIIGILIIIGIIIFFMFALQCLSTVAVSRKETGSWRIPVLQLLIYSSLAYTLSFFAVNGLRFLGLS